MTHPYSITLTHTSKTFSKSLKGFRDIKNYLLRQKSADDFQALTDVSLALVPGDTLGIIGKNGAGKSTLLKLIAGITKPATGSIQVQGRIAGLIELGAGFHQELTGKENVFLYGAILGMTKCEITEKFSAIVSFAELEEWMGTPIKFYSSGMLLRLGFSIIIHSNPDILLIDEALAVGDQGFQNKCFEKIEAFKKQKKILILISHSRELIEAHTQKTLWLDHGKVAGFGETREVLASYEKTYAENTDYAQSAHKVWDKDHQLTCPQGSLVSMSVVSESSKNGIYDIQDTLTVTVVYTLTKPDPRLLIGINLYTASGTHTLSSHGIVEKNPQNTNQGEHKVQVTIPANLLSPGEILIGVALLQQEPLRVYLEESRALICKLVDDKPNSPTRGAYRGTGFPGIVRPLLDWTITY